MSRAYFRLEGVLVDAGPARFASWMALRSQHLGDRVTGLATVVAGFAFRPRAPLADGATSRRLTFGALRGTSEDRLAELAMDYARDVLLDALRPAGWDLWERARVSGLRRILVAEHPDAALEAVVERLAPDDVVANRFEVVRGRLSGRLLDPIVGGLDGAWLRGHAGGSAEGCAVYGSQIDDAPLMSAAESCVAVHPDRGLRSLARDCGWPIVEAGA